MTASATIRAGIGGCTFEPWDTSFYPDKLAKKRLAIAKILREAKQEQQIARAARRDRSRRDL